MRSKRQIVGIAAFLGMLILTLDGKTALEGAIEGIELCIKNVIPSLFPFFVLSNLLTAVYTGVRISVLRSVGKICRLPEGLESILVPAFLGGYPVGARSIAQMWQSGCISKEEAERMLGFCNNAGPSFLFGMAAVMFPKAKTAWLLWAIQIVSALLTAQLLPGKSASPCSMTRQTISVPQSIHQAISAMASVSGWVVFFRVWIHFLRRWILWLIPTELEVLVVGMLELSNGCLSLSNIADVGVRFILCSGMLSFGGLCVMMQVASAAAKLDLTYFFIGKLIQTAFSLAISWAIVSGEYIIFGFLLLPAPLLFLKSRKNGSIPDKAGV